MIYGTAAFIAIMNNIIKLLIKICGRFSKKHTKTAEILSNTIKMFILQFLNTVRIRN